VSSELASSEPSLADAPRLNILIYLIDTLRADHLGCYGSEQALTPNIDAFAADAALFESAIAQASWTKASVASVLTGLDPVAHGTNGRDDRLPEAALTLAERLGGAGYESAALVTNPNVTEAFGFAQGFASFRDLGKEVDSDQVSQEALTWIDARSAEKPFFFYLHTLDPHTPYDPPEEMRRRFAADVPPMVARESKQLLDDLQAGRRPVDAQNTAWLKALYAAEVAANDAGFGELLAGLRQRGLYANTLVILLSDHGEEFLEHGNWEHGKSLHAESLQVPLIVRLPGARPGLRLKEEAQHLDIVPTLLDLAGLAIPEELAGRSFLPWLLGGETETTSREIFSYLHLDGPARIALRADRWVMLQQLAAGRFAWPRLYDRGTDGAEKKDIQQANPIRRGYLEARMQEYLKREKRGLSPEKAVLDPELAASLRALGYLQ
jgi:arylsulfatase A-like enzyme